MINHNIKLPLNNISNQDSVQQAVDMHQVYALDLLANGVKVQVEWNQVIHAEKSSQVMFN